MLGRDIQLSRLEPPTSIRQSRLPRSSLELDAQSRLSRFCPKFRAVDSFSCARVSRLHTTCPCEVGDPRTTRQPFLMLGAHRETVPPNELSPALPLLEKQARFRVPSDAASRPTAGVPLQTPQALMRAMHINSTPLCADRDGCQAEFFVTIFCGLARCESLPTFRVAKVFPARFARGKAAHRAP